ncbi:MAG: CinA family protein [Tatlockia sp.]|nr:CinA family protein [Tatlockia sp.]
MIELTDLVRTLTENLSAKHLKITTAESCTGGLIAYLLTELPGSSAWFDRGFVTYSNLAKQEMLGINLKLLKKHGAVSREVAEAMAQGALAHSAADIALAVTGIAGPDGGSRQKPVGTVWIAWAGTNFPVRSVDFYFPDTSRQQVRQQACAKALEGAISIISL